MKSRRGGRSVAEVLLQTMPQSPNILHEATLARDTLCVTKEIATPLALNITDLENIQRCRNVATYLQGPTDLLPSTDPQCGNWRE